MMCGIYFRKWQPPAGVDKHESGLLKFGGEHATNSGKKVHQSVSSQQIKGLFLCLWSQNVSKKNQKKKPCHWSFIFKLPVTRSCLAWWGRLYEQKLLTSPFEFEPTERLLLALLFFMWRDMKSLSRAVLPFTASSFRYFPFYCRREKHTHTYNLQWHHFINTTSSLVKEAKTKALQEDSMLITNTF